MRVPAHAEHLRPIRQAVRSFADAYCDHSSDTQLAVALSVTEACTNVVRHAYPGRDGMLTLAVSLEHRHLLVEVLDDGVGLEGKSDPDGLGLGLPLIRRLAETRITSSASGTQLQLRFPRSSPVAV